MGKELQRKGIERLEDIRFWLAVLRKFDQFIEPQKQKIDQAYRIINKIYESFKLESKPDYIVKKNKDIKEKEKPYNADELGIY